MGISFAMPSRLPVAAKSSSDSQWLSWAKTGPLRWLLSSYLPCAIGEVVGAETSHGSEAVTEGGGCLMDQSESIESMTALPYYS